LGAALNNAISPPHQLARQLLDSLAKVSVPAHVEQLIDNIFQRCRINIAAESLRDLARRWMSACFPAFVCLGSGAMLSAKAGSLTFGRTTEKAPPLPAGH
jgi:hypothetical protein